MQQIVQAILANYEFRRQKTDYPPHPNVEE